MEREICLAPDVDQVTLCIERPKPTTERLTLRKAIMILPVDVPLDVIVKDGGVLEDGRIVDTFWKIGFGAATPNRSMVNQCRQDRIQSLCACTLCDTQVLLDEREAVINVCKNITDVAYITVTIEANPKNK